MTTRPCQQAGISLLPAALNLLRIHRVVLVFDPDEQLQPLFSELSTSPPTEELQVKSICWSFRRSGSSLAPACLLCANSLRTWSAATILSPC